MGYSGQCELTPLPTGSRLLMIGYFILRLPAGASQLWSFVDIYLLPPLYVWQVGVFHQAALSLSSYATNVY